MDITTEVETLSAIFEGVRFEDNVLSCPLRETVESYGFTVEGGVVVSFTIPADYPEEIPTVTFGSEEAYVVRGFPRFTQEITELLQENLGTSCLFEMVDKTKDLLVEMLEEEAVARRDAEIVREKKEEEEREKAFIGASKQSFEEWWKGKEKERERILAQIQKEKDEERAMKKGRITGKQFFLNNPRMAEQTGEASLLPDDEEAVESLLQDQGVDLEMFADDDLDV